MVLSHFSTRIRSVPVRPLPAQNTISVQPTQPTPCKICILITHSQSMKPIAALPFCISSHITPHRRAQSLFSLYSLPKPSTRPNTVHSAGPTPRWVYNRNVKIVLVPTASSRYQVCRSSASLIQSNNPIARLQYFPKRMEATPPRQGALHTGIQRLAGTSNR